MTEKKSVLGVLAAFATSMIAFSLLYKQIGLQGWQTQAFIGGAVLFFIIAVITRIVFNLPLIPSLMVSAFVMAILMAFVSPDFSFLMIVAFFIMLILILAIMEERENKKWP